MLRPCLVSTALALLAGCASPPPAPQAAAPGATPQVADANPNARKQVCVREQPIGSAIPATRCHYQEDGVDREINVGGFANKVYRSVPATSTGGGG
jgi:hypothetical protein